jgi:hypothetical protein
MSNLLRVVVRLERGRRLRQAGRACCGIHPGLEQGGWTLLSLVIIPTEASQLRVRFGDDQDVYCGHVRRWLTGRAQ